MLKNKWLCGKFILIFINDKKHKNKENKDEVWGGEEEGMLGNK